MRPNFEEWQWHNWDSSQTSKCQGDKFLCCCLLVCRGRGKRVKMFPEFYRIQWALNIKFSVLFYIPSFCTDSNSQVSYNLHSFRFTSIWGWIKLHFFIFTPTFKKSNIALLERQVYVCTLQIHVFVGRLQYKFPPIYSCHIRGEHISLHCGYRVSHTRCFY